MDAALKYSVSEQEGKAAALSFEVEVGGREILSFAPSTKKGKNPESLLRLPPVYMVGKCLRSLLSYVPQNRIQIPAAENLPDDYK